MKGAKVDVWFYQNRLSIKNGVVRLEKSPEEHIGKEVVYSASDGGFPTFRGRLVARGHVTVAVLEIESCDYCVGGGMRARKHGMSLIMASCARVHRRIIQSS